MLDIVSVAFLGFLLGLRHATDADHVVAVTAIVARERSVWRAARIGALWGVGHSVTVLAVGGTLVATRYVIPPRIALGLEFGVALMLIVLGFANLRHDPPSSDSDSLAAPARVRGSSWKPLVVGTVHGLAGSAAVSLLVLATIRSTSGAIAYLVIFGAGTVAGMMLVTLLFAAPARFAARRASRMQRGIRLAAGALSIAFGMLLARELVVHGGLLSDTPTWSPR
ncbi:MAG TPA: hypothetical protein VFG84_10855 [Gemmatimonadaceae bacterium]|nr:hypothetical protein [Gemmatimonadaceae bacterium]